jgi:FkbM family methyltransferase
MEKVSGALQRIQHRLFSTMRKELKETEKRLDDKITASEKVIQSTQLAINHDHSLILEELKQRAKNSGSIVLNEAEMVTKIFSGLKMYLDPRDVAVVPHLALDSIWEHRITAAWLAVVKPDDTVLDVGSNFGYFGALAAQKSDKKKSKVVHFEANPHLIPYIHKTLNVNWLNEQSVVENLGVGEKEGTLTLRILKDYLGSSSVLPLEHTAKYMGTKMPLETAEEVKVKATTLDKYCKDNKIKTVDLIKMDIEGYEDKAYAGMRDIVKNSPNLTFFIEFTKDSYDDPKGFYDQMLKDFGNVYVIDDEGYIIKPKKKTYEAIIGDADDWVMPIFSKNAKLANR